jgi:single-stranded-DNA-specific exonuclease
MIRTTSAPPPEFIAAIGGHYVVAEILWRRGLTDAEAARAFLDPDAYTPVPPEQLPGMAEAVACLLAAIANGDRIRVWGDFDADGQTSTSVLLLGLRALGAVVDYTIPNRAHHSHGLNKPGIARAHEDGVRVLLTCDCGVTDFDEVAYARSLGLDVIISDHHDLAERLPDARAVINPKRLPEDHAVAHLPGVGVAYKLIEGLVNGSVGARERGSKGAEERGSAAGLFSPAPRLPASPAQLLDLVALGIVADVAYQRDDTRYLLQRGLALLRSNPRPGVRALLRVANIEPSDLNADGIGYQIGPRLNAVGRLDDAATSVELLTTEDPARANELAAKVETLNQERKVLQRAVEDEAFRQIAQNPSLSHRAAIVLTSSSWHPSVLGVVASAVCNRYGKPAILISMREGEIGRGSARSVRGVDIHAALTAQGELIETSGGHPMAAGFAIRSENVAAFREGINQYVAAHTPAAAPPDTETEAVLAWQDVSLRLSEDLERLAPFGPGNPRPLLRSERLTLVRTEPLGTDGRHQALFLRDESGHVNKAVWWRSSGQSLPDVCDLIFTVHHDLFRGKPRMQVQVVRLEEGQTITIPYTITGRFRVIDKRGVADPAAELQRVVEQFGAGNVQLWAEGAGAELTLALNGNGASLASLASLTRLQLETKPILVILTVPPGAGELAAALKRASPQTIVLLTPAGVPERDQPGVVLQQWVSMLKAAEQRGESPADAGVTARMAARIGHREATIQACAEHYRALRAQDKAGSAKAMGKLIFFLEETHGYRRYFQEVPAETVLRDILK